MIENYKDVKDFEGKYQVSNFGQILSLSYGRTGKPKLLKPQKTKDGYLRVGLSKNGKRKSFLVHRLVAETFIPNSNNLIEVNHKDEDKTNNRTDNLEWCDRKYNMNYGTCIERIVKKTTNGKLSKTVLQFTKSGDFVREWISAKECGRNGFILSCVIRCCQGKRKSHKGYIWQYK